MDAGSLLGKAWTCSMLHQSTLAGNAGLNFVKKPSRGRSCRLWSAEDEWFEMNPANLFKHETDPIQLAAGDILFRECEP